jgi:hypothetical protein
MKPTHCYCINQDKNVDNEVYYVCIKFPNLRILLTVPMVAEKLPRLTLP